MVARISPSRNKRPGTASRSSKNRLISSNNWLRKKSFLIFIALFAVIGSVVTYRSFALEVDPDLILASYTVEKPSTITKDASGNITYNSISSSNIVLKDGTLLCDDGNAQGDVTMGRLNKPQLNNLYNALDMLDIETLPDNIAPPGTKAFVNNYSGFMLTKGDEATAVDVYPGSSQPSILSTMQNKMQQVCSTASVRQKRGMESRKPKQPRRRQNNVSALNRASGYSKNALQQVADLFMPHAGASPAAETGWEADYDTTAKQRDAVNYVRGLGGLQGLKAEGCLNILAGRVAWANAHFNRLFHSNGGNLIGAFEDQYAPCPNQYWLSLGENVGTGSSSDQIFQAYLNSAGHRANILNPKFNRVGTYAYKNTSTGQIYTATWFAQW